MTASIVLVYDGMLDLAARMKLQAFDRGFVDTQFLLNASAGKDDFLKKGSRAAWKLLGQVGITNEPAVGRSGSSPANGATRKLAASWVERLKPEEAHGCAGSLSNCSSWTLAPE